MLPEDYDQEEQDSPEQDDQSKNEQGNTAPADRPEQYDRHKPQEARAAKSMIKGAQDAKEAVSGLTSGDLAESGEKLLTAMPDQAKKDQEENKKKKDQAQHPAKQLAKQKAKQAAKKGIKNLAKKAATKNPYARMAVQVATREGRRQVQRMMRKGAQQAVRQLARSLIRAGVQGLAKVVLPTNPVSALIWLIVIILLLVFLIIMLIIFGGASDSKCAGKAANPQPTISKTGPDSVANSADIKYTLSATFPGQATDLSLVEKIPADATFVSATGTFTEQREGDKVTSLTWRATENGGTGSGPIQVDVVIKPTKPDFYLINMATVTVFGAQVNANCCEEGGGSGAVAEGYVPPSDQVCPASPLKNSPIGKNFGDPTCSFDKEKLHTLLKEKDPEKADWWFNKVVPCESTYNPNQYAGPQTGTPDAAGAWGLYQTGSSTPPGQAPPAPGTNGPNDRGDVNWELQTSNAVNLLKSNGPGYWACAN